MRFETDIFYLVLEIIDFILHFFYCSCLLFQKERINLGLVSSFKVSWNLFHHIVCGNITHLIRLNVCLVIGTRLPVLQSVVFLKWTFSILIYYFGKLLELTGHFDLIVTLKSNFVEILNQIHNNLSIHCLWFFYLF